MPDRLACRPVSKCRNRALARDRRLMTVPMGTSSDSAISLYVLQTNNTYESWQQQVYKFCIFAASATFVSRSPPLGKFRVQRAIPRRVLLGGPQD